MRAGRVAAREELGVQLVHLAREAVAPSRTQCRIVPVTQKIIAQQRVVDERLQDHIQKAG